jgi:multiple sugar transport system permease protein
LWYQASQPPAHCSMSPASPHSDPHPLTPTLSHEGRGQREGRETRNTRSRTLREIGRHLLIYAGLAPFVVIAMFPVFWMAITAFKEEADLYRMDQFPLWFHLPPTLKNFRILFAQTYFWTLLLNTLLLSVCVVLITVVTAVPAGYVLTRLRLKGAETIGIAVFLTYLVPPIVLFLPLARVVGMLGLWDSWWALVVVYPTFTIPFCTWLIMGFFKTLPREIEEAAWVDGCGVVGGIMRVVLPLSRPGIMITTIFAFTLSMQEVLYAVVYVAVRDQKTVTAGITAALIRGDIYYWGSLMAAALLVGVPIAILYMFYIDHFIRGLIGTTN